MTTALEYDDKKQRTILVVDDSKVIRKNVSYMLSAQNYKVLNATNGNEALDVLKKEKVSIVITDVNMPKAGGFSLIENLHKLSLSIPYIMMTDSNINMYLDLAIKNNVGNILSKPIEKGELLTTVYKLLYPKTLFGLHNYLNIKKKDLKTIYIKGSKECSKIIPIIIKKAEDTTKLTKDALSALYLVLSELAINAIYHPHGFTKEKEERKLVKLDDGDEIQIQYASDSLKFGVSITDFAGKLTKLTILSSFKDFFISNERIKQALKEGSDPLPFIKDKGRGLQLAREMSNEYYFNIQKDKITQLIILTKLDNLSSIAKGSSIKINEIA